MVTYSFTDGGNPGSQDFATISEAFTQAGTDLHAAAGKVPVSIDDHEGNFYDAAEIARRFAPRGDD